MTSFTYGIDLHFTSSFASNKLKILPAELKIVLNKKGIFPTLWSHHFFKWSMINKYNFNINYKTIVQNNLATWHFNSKKGLERSNIFHYICTRMLSKYIIHN